MTTTTNGRSRRDRTGHVPARPTDRRDRSTRRGRVAIALALGGLAVGGLATAALPAGAAPSPSRITITTSPLPAAEGCLSPAQAVSASPFSDATTFRLRVRVSATLCTPVSATAAVYAMPTGGAAWPQTLVEAVPFTLSAPAVVDITFAKDCTPSQFDVVTGATPQVIAPWGAQHGPLLVPDTATAFQDPGIACAPAGSTTVAPTTTTAGGSAAPTTIAVTTVAPATTTTAVVRGATTTSVAVAVLDTTSDPSDPASPASLAVTGVSSQTLTAWGCAMAASGAALLWAARRRAVPAARMVTSAWSVQRRSPFSTQ